MKHPPHLPKPPEKEPLLERHPALPWFLLVVVLAFVTAVAGSLSTIAWLGPSSSDTNIIRTLRAQLPSGGREVSLDPFVEQQVRQRMVTVYDARKKINGFVYPESAAVGVAVLLNSEGWAAMYAPDYRDGTYKNLQAVGNQGNIYSLLSAQKDPVSDIVYFKIQGDGFRGDISFFNWDGANVVGESFVRIGTKDIGAVHIQKATRIANTESFALSKQIYAFQISGDHSIGDILVTEQGNFVGFAGLNGTLQESWYVAGQLQSLFDTGTISYTGIHASGVMVRGIQVNGILERHVGFLITQSPTRASSSTLGVGDVVVSVNGKLFDERTAGQDILNATSPVSVRVFRGGEELDITVEKIKI